MSIEKYINNIKNALRRVEVKLCSNDMEGIDKKMAFAFRQISKREQICGEHLKQEDTARCLRILMAKYFDLYIRIKFHNAWELFGMYQTFLDNGQYNNALEINIQIYQLLNNLTYLYEVASRHNMERIQVADCQPFINIPAQFYFLMSCIDRVFAQTLKPTEYDQLAAISPANNRFSHFYQPPPSEEILSESEKMQERFSFR
ncbi:hypothetical protein [uncultured Legionella sp.]|uniref:hypothetical protein n=1 Tax=uncultured Legionella sp. TaxID=210934 RepID=UPI00260C277C|nr:hypothetical protein [uncultured Legionella sp.]